MFKDGSDLERPMNSEAVVKRLFDYGNNERLKLTSKEVDSQGRLLGRGTFLDQDGQEIQVAGFLGSVGPEEGLVIMVFGWVITDVNGQKLKEPKYLLAEVAEIDIDDRKRILSKAGFEEAMRRLARKCNKGNLQSVPEMRIYYQPKGRRSLKF